MENSLIMIPSLEPDHKLLALVEKIRLHNQHLPILVVDDGSGAAYLFGIGTAVWLSGFDPSKESWKRRSHQNRPHRSADKPASC